MKERHIRRFPGSSLVTDPICVRGCARSKGLKPLAPLATSRLTTITAANLMDQKMSDPPSSSPKLLTFDASVVNAFIVKQEWEGLDDYLGKLVATILKKIPDEVAMMHPA
ncbi:uncharacterized protein [Miscanthus floridulus]|uniref:uncharacterized protein n=1 Tax=Miscanthus floridulus TaxID=154761 RepID=UPI0034580D8D